MNAFGYVFRNRYRSESIFDNLYLKQCIVYIHNNPVKAGICKKPSDYLYSSYNEIVANQSLFVSINSAYDIFESLDNFKDFHKKVKMNSYLDISEEKELYLQEEIESFLSSNNIDYSNLHEKINVLKPFVKEILDKKVISKNELSDRLNVSKYMLNKIYNN